MAGAATDVVTWGMATRRTTAAAASTPPIAMTTPGSKHAAMGLRALTVSMTNCGDRSYSVNGYPVVRVLDGDRKPLDVQVALGTRAITADPAWAADPQPVTLAPGGTVTAVVVWRNLVTDPTVVATTGRYLEIAPVGGAPAQTVNPRGGIDLGNTGRLGVGPWKAGAE